MSEDKIMDIVKGKLLMINKMLEQDQEEGHGSAYEMQAEDFEAIQGLLDLYNKGKEKNKNVRDRIEYYLLNNSTIENNPERLREELIKLQDLLEEDNK